jgi:hypothetical protein
VPSERTEVLAAAESTDPTDPAEPIEKADPNDPIDPTDSADPAEPIERNEPLEERALGRHREKRVLGPQGQRVHRRIVHRRLPTHDPSAAR